MKQSWTKAVFKSVQPYVSEQKRSWFEDMRSEALHISSDWRRFLFVLGCLRFCAVIILRERVGVRLIGQLLIAAAVLSFCIFAILINQAKLSVEAPPTVYFLLLAYAIAGCLTVINLHIMKRYVVISAFGFFLVWLSLFWPDLVSEQLYTQALFLEGTIFMIALYIAASFVNWTEDKTYV